MVYGNIDMFLHKVSDDVIFFCVANTGVEKLVRNLIESATRANQPLVVFALDQGVVDCFKGKVDIVKYYDTDIIANKTYRCPSMKQWNTSDFKKIVFHRFVIGNLLLREGRDICYVDTDTIFKRNCVSMVRQLFADNEDVDCFIQRGEFHKGKQEHVCCTGVFAIRSNEITRSILTQSFLEKHDYTKYIHDQHFFNVVIYKHGLDEGSLIEVRFLDETKFPNGGDYVRNSEVIDSGCYIIHFNAGYLNLRQKIKLMKKYGYWFI
jgi:hypothetical protein